MKGWETSVSSELVEISSELVEISSELVEISSELVEISSELVLRSAELLITSVFRIQASWVSEHPFSLRIQRSREAGVFTLFKHFAQASAPFVKRRFPLHAGVMVGQAFLPCRKKLRRAALAERLKRAKGGENLPFHLVLRLPFVKFAYAEKCALHIRPEGRHHRLLPTPGPTFWKGRHLHV